MLVFFLHAHKEVWDVGIGGLMGVSWTQGWTDGSTVRLSGLCNKCTILYVQVSLLIFVIFFLRGKTKTAESPDCVNGFSRCRGLRRVTHKQKIIFRG